MRNQWCLRAACVAGGTAAFIAFVVFSPLALAARLAMGAILALLTLGALLLIPPVGPRKTRTVALTPQDTNWAATLAVAAGAGRLRAADRIDDVEAQTLVWEAATLPHQADEIAAQVDQTLAEVDAAAATDADVEQALDQSLSEPAPGSPPAECSSLPRLEALRTIIRDDHTARQEGLAVLRDLDRPGQDGCGSADRGVESTPRPARLDRSGS